jgi:hypothetical protein
VVTERRVGALPGAKADRQAGRVLAGDAEVGDREVVGRAQLVSAETVWVMVSEVNAPV